MWCYDLARVNPQIDALLDRFAHETIPMDDALVDIVLDAGGRSYYDGRLPDPMHEHVLRSLAHEAGLTLHVDVRRGRDPHHVTEAAFKALGWDDAQVILVVGLCAGAAADFTLLQAMKAENPAKQGLPEPKEAKA